MLNQMPRTVLIANNNSVIRESIYAILCSHPDYDVVGVCADGQEALKVIKDLQPNVALIDFGLKIIDGLTITEKLRQKSIPTKIILRTNCTNEHVIKRALETGAYVFCCVKSELELLECLNSVCNNEKYTNVTVFNQHRLTAPA
jgi:two-component system response regulator DesR